jgi:hypothetical protein
MPCPVSKLDLWLLTRITVVDEYVGGGGVDVEVVIIVAGEW